MIIVGVHAIAYAFPKVKMISTALDEKVNDLYHIIPGIGLQSSYMIPTCVIFNFQEILVIDILVLTKL